jgi:hypothetical protein
MIKKSYAEAEKNLKNEHKFIAEAMVHAAEDPASADKTLARALAGIANKYADTLIKAKAISIATDLKDNAESAIAKANGDLAIAMSGLAPEEFPAAQRELKELYDELETADRIVDSPAIKARIKTIEDIIRPMAAVFPTAP